MKNNMYFIVDLDAADTIDDLLLDELTFATILEP